MQQLITRLQQTHKQPHFQKLPYKKKQQHELELQQLQQELEQRKKRPKGGQTAWISANDFVFSYVEQKDVLNFTEAWKTPCILCYARQDTQLGDADELQNINPVKP